MPIEITMPRLSDTMEVGTVIKWNVKEGDEVSAGDVLADIETDKATMELQCFDDGTVAKIIAQEGDNVEVGKQIMIIAEEGEDVAEAAASAGAASGAPAKQESGSDTPDETPSATAVATPAAPTTNGVSTNGAAPSTNGTGGRVFASPLARKLAEEKGVDLHSITGSGPSGRIVKKDVEAASGGAAPSGAPSLAPAPSMPVAKLEARRHELNNMRRTIATRLSESKGTIPHYQVTVTVRMDKLMAFRKELNGQLEVQGVKLSVNDFLVKACALAMHQHPFVNSSFLGDAIQIHPDVNVGVAIALPEERGGGLVVATLRNADSVPLRTISSQTKELAIKARERGLSIEEMSDSTFTISNLGMFGVEHFNAIINPPNVAILAVGGAVKKPVVNDSGDIVVGHEMQMTLSSDHRVIDGAMAAAYLGTVKSYLENPATILV
ncbi:MAG: dihydrolipoamide acetyltransferase family protein [Phycisphaerales bacterium JB043]